MLGGILTIGLIAVCIAIITANERRKRIFVQRPSDDPFEEPVGDWPNLSEISGHRDISL
jgi:hypothetical protein